MKKNIFRPLAAVAFVAFTLTGCASSTDTVDDTTAMDTTMSETETMGGTTAAETSPAMAETSPTAYDFDIVVLPDPSDTYENVFSNMEDPVEYDEMFEDIDETENYDVLALARKNPNLSTFVRLIEITDLEDDLQRIDGFTVFAPTNEAFAKIPKLKLEMLLMPGDKAALSRLLQAHVLPTEVYSTQLSENNIIELTEDRHIPVEVTMGGSTIMVGGATIIQPNIEAKNGVLHVVDNVIVPSEDAVKDEFGIY